SINEAMSLVKTDPAYPIPLHLRNAPTQMMKNMDYGKGYKYSHDFQGENHQEFMPEELVGHAFYRPKEAGVEAKIRRFLQEKWGKKYQ
ncbi:MAG: replication-associated recombination protein A, partial [Bacteroidia bacterium]|nr:replication-associated recombination protein A [Bacteroidia bacterium]